MDKWESLAEVELIWAEQWRILARKIATTLPSLAKFVTSNEAKEEIDSES